MSARFVFVDTEATGLDHTRHELTEVSWIVRFEDGSQVERQYFTEHTIDGADEGALADAFIAQIRDLNARFGIPAAVDKLQTGDIPVIAANARSEANWFYAVPRYMDRPTSEGFLRQLLAA